MARPTLTIGGSADLTHSNLTITKGMESVKPGSFGGRYIHYGVREHGMAAAMNGLALHGGFIPYGGTFLIFSDYARGAIRLSALMGVRVIYVLTHDSIGLGEDGPTHQPVEIIPSLRALPNMLVFRPCDAVETSESWAVALAEKSTPSSLALSRQALTPLRTEASSENLTAKGAYVLREADGKRDVTLLATGSEVEIAVAAAHELAHGGSQGRRGLDALLGVVRAPERGLSAPGARNRAARRRRSRAALRLGPLARRDGPPSSA